MIFIVIIIVVVKYIFDIEKKNLFQEVFQS